MPTRNVLRAPWRTGALGAAPCVRTRAWRMPCVPLMTKVRGRLTRPCTACVAYLGTCAPAWYARNRMESGARRPQARRGLGAVARRVGACGALVRGTCDAHARNMRRLQRGGGGCCAAALRIGSAARVCCLPWSTGGAHCRPTRCAGGWTGCVRGSARRPRVRLSRRPCCAMRSRRGARSARTWPSCAPYKACTHARGAPRTHTFGAGWRLSRRPRVYHSDSTYARHGTSSPGSSAGSAHRRC